jgi:hypothetical protein
MMYWLLFLTFGVLVSVAEQSIWPAALVVLLAVLGRSGEGELHSTVGKAINGVFVLVLAFLCVCVVLMIARCQP